MRAHKTALLILALLVPALGAWADRSLYLGEELQAASGAGSGDNGGWRAYSAWGGGLFLEMGGDVFSFRPALLYMHQNTAWLDWADSRPEEHHLGQLQVPLLFKFSAPLGAVRPCMILGPRAILTMDDQGTPQGDYRWHVPIGFTIGLGCDFSVPGGALQFAACYDQDGDQFVFGNPGFVRLSLAYAFEAAHSEAGPRKSRRQRVAREGSLAPVVEAAEAPDPEGAAGVDEDSAVALYRAKRYDEAREAFSLLLKEKPGDARLLRYLGSCEWDLGQHAKAAGHMHQAVDADPAHSQGLADWLEQQGY
jgi:tetratricopeptide (TPR) repeat protein